MRLILRDGFWVVIIIIIIINKMKMTFLLLLTIKKISFFLFIFDYRTYSRISLHSIYDHEIIYSCN